MIWKKSWMIPLRDLIQEKNGVICRAGVIKAGKEGEIVEEKHLVPSSLS